MTHALHSTCVALPLACCSDPTGPVTSADLPRPAGAIMAAEQRRFWLGILENDHTGASSMSQRTAVLIKRGSLPYSTLIDTDLLALRSEEHTSELQSLRHLVCRLLL